jgi:hypothetical protein
MIKQLNENALLRRFHSYLSEGLKVQDAVEMMLDEADMTVEKVLAVQDVLIPEIIILFAEKYDQLTNVYDYDSIDDDINLIFETFLRFEGLDDSNLDLASQLAAAINTAAMYDDDGNEDADDSDDPESDEDENDVVFKGQEEWGELSDEERQDKVKAFLRKLARVGADARDMNPFLKSLDVGPNPYGVSYTNMTKTFDREENRFGHSNELGNWASPNESIFFPNSSGQGHDEFHKAHPLHKTLEKFGYRYSHSTPVTQRDNSVLHHHTWVHASGHHHVGAYEGDTKFSTKTSSSSGHVFSGIGVHALERHLASKAKRYKLQTNESSVPHVPMLESLLSGQDKVQMYARWMAKNEPKTFGVADSCEPNSQIKDLLEAEKLKAKSDKIFNRDGKDRSDWSLFDQRSGQPK